MKRTDANTLEQSYVTGWDGVGMGFAVIKLLLFLLYN